ncbi:MAG: hypothetical protein WBA12_04555, partial [Catalinimonas sp.]
MSLLPRLFLISFVWLQVPAAAQRLDLYPAPPGLPAAPDFTMKVDERDCFVYDNPVAAYAQFSFEGEIE